MILAQLTDFHLRPPGRACYRVSETNMLAERAVRAVARLRVRPDALIISGDLVDDGLASEYVLFKEILGRHIDGIPVYVIPGNHDARGPFKAELAAFPGVSDDPVFVHYTVENLLFRLVMLDTIVPGAAHGALCDARLAWLETTLSAQPERPTIVVMHHPPFVCGIAHIDAINLRDANRFAAIISRHRQVERILCGHHHRPIVARVGHAIASVAPSVAHQVELDLDAGEQGFFVMEPPAFQLHIWCETSGIVTHTAYVEDYPGPFPFIGEPER